MSNGQRSIYVETRLKLITLLEDVQLHYPNGFDRWTPGDLREILADLQGARLIKLRRNHP